ncbi:MAG TPA: DMT family transporter [Devosia sp.]|nr:DMT family transporter [Devosia sp.]
MKIRDWLIITLLGAVWGSSFLFNAVLIREIGPLWVSAGRVGIGALGSWVFVFALKKRVPLDMGLYLHAFALGTLSYAIPFALFPLSQNYLASGVAAIINAMLPITTVIVSHFWLGGEKTSWNKSLGVAAGFTGVLILASPILASGGTSELWAIAACLLATLCYAVALNWTRSFNHVEPTVLAALALTGASFAAIPMAFLVHGAPSLATIEGWASVIAIGLFATAFAFQIMYRMLPRVGATNFSVTTFIAPVSAIILGTLLLNEKLLPAHYMGMAGIFIGLLLIDGRILKRWRKAPSGHP